MVPWMADGMLTTEFIKRAIVSAFRFSEASQSLLIGECIMKNRTRESEFAAPSEGVPRIGSGQPPVVRRESQFDWQTLSVRAATENIAKPTDWRITDKRHVIIVHMGGEMRELETELEGQFGSIGPATPGQIWSVPAGSSYAGYASGGDIEFAVLHLPTRPEDSKREIEIEHLAGLRDDRLHGDVARLLQLAGASDDVSQMEAESLAGAISADVISRYRRSHNKSRARNCLPVPTLGSHQSRMIREYIWDNLSESISLSQLSNLVGMTTHHLLIAFRDVFGTTPAQYLINQRLRRAEWLLLYTHSDITTIALDTGFSSHSHLTSMFKQRFGYPPSRFRERLREH